MNSLIKEIENNIQEAVTGFVQLVSEKYDMDTKELMELWYSYDAKKTMACKVSACKLTKKPSEKKPSEKKPSEKKPSATKSEGGSSTASGEGCPYVYTKGQNEGNMCGSKPKNGSTYCSRHKKYEGTEPKQKKVLPISKKSITGSAKIRKSPAKKIINNVLRTHKVLGKLWHSETQMVFRSPKDRVVIGKCVDDELRDLTEEDIEVCKSRGFKFEEPEDEEEEKPEDEEEEKPEDEEEEKPEDEEEEEPEDEEEDEEEEPEDEEEEEEPEEEKEEEEKPDEVEVANKAARKITAVPKSLKNLSTNKTLVAKGSKSAKKTLMAKGAKSIKKSVAEAIAETNIQAADIEQILGELQAKPIMEEEEVFEEEDIEETATDDEDEYEGELLEEEDDE